MPRPCKCRRVAAEPPCTLFKPAGVPGRGLPRVTLGLDEVEALRLADVEGLYHDAAAAEMGVSRATFGRLIEQARRKVATALLHGQALAMEGGPVMRVDEREFRCADCGEAWRVPFGVSRPTACPKCGGTRLHRADAGRGDAGGRAGAGRGRCRRRWRGGVGAGAMAARRPSGLPASQPCGSTEAGLEEQS